MCEQGMFVQEFKDNNGQITFDVLLKAQCFLEYKMPKIEGEGSKYITMGFGTQDFKNALSTILSTDTLTMSIHPSNIDVVAIEIEKKNSPAKINNFFTLCSTALTNVITPVYVDHTPNVTVAIPAYQAIFKSMKKSTNDNALVLVCAQAEGIKFSDNTKAGMHGNGGVLGTYNDAIAPICTYLIPQLRLRSFSEVSAISTRDTIRIYASPDLPLRLSTDAGALGPINMYLTTPSAQPEQ
tara:strand:- start:370 stop:1086 length:717 start_codon:yes stop_codon:yes gene_type:complete